MARPGPAVKIVIASDDAASGTRRNSRTATSVCSPSLSAAGKAGTDRPTNVAAGDGSESAYQRIRAKQYQAVTVAEPLNLQGWQLVDELNRAMAGEGWSKYVSPLHVVTSDNVEFDGGPKNTFDPDNGYRDAYKKIWGV